MTTALTAAVQAAPRPRNLVLHQLRKDLRRHRWILLAWLGLLLGLVGLIARGSELFLGTPTVATLLLDLVLLALVGRLMFEDPLVGDDHAFWLTFPLPWKTLLGARLLLLGLVAWLPLVLAEYAGLLILALPEAQRLPALLQAALGQAALVLSWAVLASLLYGYLRLFGAALLATLGLLLLMIPQQPLLERLGPDPFTLGMESARGFDRAWLPAALALLTLAALGVLGLLHRVGRRAPSPVARFGATLPLLALWLVALDLVALSNQDVRRQAPHEATMPVFQQPIGLNPVSAEEARGYSPGEFHRRLAGQIVITHDLAGYRLVPAGIRSRLDLADGTAWASTYSRWLWTSDRSGGGHNDVPGFGVPDPRFNTDTFTRHLLTVPAGIDDARNPARAGVLTADIALDGFRYEPGPTLPLRRGCAATVGTHGLRVGDVTVSPERGLRIVLFDLRARVRRDEPETFTPLAYALQVGDGRVVRLQGASILPGPRLLTLLPVINLRRNELVLDPVTAAQLGLTGPRAEAIGRARLLVSRESYVGTFTRSLRVENFRPADW